MEARFKVDKPGDIVFTMTLTMNADQWEKLRDQLDASSLSTSYPAHRLRQNVSDLLAQARKVYWPSAPADPQ